MYKVHVKPVPTRCPFVGRSVSVSATWKSILPESKEVMAARPTAKRRQFTLEEKISVLRAVDSGQKKSNIAKDFGISASTLSTFLKDRDKIQREYNESNAGSASRKRIRTANFEDIDKSVYKWFLEVRSQDIPVSGPMLCAKARDFAVIYGVDEQFKATQGWLRAFRSRHDVVFKGVAGEENSAPQDIAQGWREREMLKILSEYDPDDIFNADETALFFKLLPERTLTVKGEKCKGGKRSKERITVLFCCNMTGTMKLRPLVIGRSRKPHAFRNMCSLPTDYQHNQKAWMTSAIFTEWLTRVDRIMKGKERHIVLILDNCSAHSKVPRMSNVRVVLLPPNCTSILQPLDQGIIRSAKSHYRRRMIERILINIKANVQRPTNIDVRQAMEMITGAWWNVRQEVIENCWRKAGFVLSTVEPTPEHETCDDEAYEGLCHDESFLEAWESYASTVGVPETVAPADFVAVDDNVVVRPQLSDTDICAEVALEKEVLTDDSHDEESDREEEPQATRVSAVEAIEMIDRLQCFLASCTNVPEAQFKNLDSLRTYCNQSAISSLVQKKVTDFFASK